MAIVVMVSPCKRGLGLKPIWGAIIISYLRLTALQRALLRMAGVMLRGRCPQARGGAPSAPRRSPQELPGDPDFRRRREGRHHVAGKAAQLVARARSVEQDVGDAGILQHG